MTDAPLAIRAVRVRLRRLRRGARALLATRAASALFTWGLLIVAALVLADLVFRFPAFLRGLFLAGLVGAGVWFVARRIGPITRFKPSLADLALRVERRLEQRPRTPIASGIELPISDPDPFTRSLSRIAAATAASGFPRTPWGILRWGAPGRALGLLAVVAVGLAFVFNAQPTLAVTGLTRLFAPWAETPWPKRTEIADATPTGAHAADTGLALRAALLRTNRPAGETSITVDYRVIGEEGESTATARGVLTPQPSGEDAGRAASEVYERLIEPSVWRGVPGERRWLEYTLRSEDDATATKRIPIVDPPALAGRVTTVTPPGYAGGLEAAFASGTEAAPPPPAGELIEVGPILRGSSVLVELEYNKPVMARPVDGTPESVEITRAGRTIRVESSPGESLRLALDAIDSHGLMTRDPALLELAVVADAPPEATVLLPSSDEAVLPSATIELIGEGRDDIALTSLELQSRVARPDETSLGGEPAPDPDVEPATIGETDPGLARRAEVGLTLELGGFDLSPGDELWVRAAAADNFELDGRRHDAVLSAPRRLRVIAEAEFIELVQAELEGVRRTAIRLDRQQAELEERAQDPEQSGEQTARMQAGVSQRIRAQDAMLRKLAERTERNNLDDEPMRRLLENAAEIAGRAGEASERAAEELGERRREEAAQAQRRVRDELARLVDQLDRGQDGWVARRNLERLLSDEQAVRERTRELARRTVGRELGELTPDERTELERIADRQRELAQRARDAADELSRSADELRENDPTQASAMDRAAEQAAREALAEKLEEAAEDIAQNRSANAGRLQEQSIEAMQGMLEELENAQRRRDEALRRELASTIATIESLIRQQEAAIASLDEPEPDAELERRLHANTLGAEAETRASFPELASVADLLARAADAQARAIGAIRAGEIDAALNAETESLARLSEALEEARRQDEQAAQREQDRKRRELREAYRDALAQQNALRDETGELAGHEPNRRRRARLRDVGQRQEGLRTDIEAIPERHEAGDIGVISLFHRRIDGALTEAVRSLGRGRGDEGVLARQSEAAAMLKAIVETLSEPPGGQDDEFRNAGGGGGGGGGAGGGDQPVVADLQQLKLLRALQAIVLDQTRAAPGSAPATALAQTQRDIATQARALIERADRNPEPGAPESPSEPPEGP